MKRVLVLGFTLLGGAGLAGQTPVSVYPGTTVRTGTAAESTRLPVIPAAGAAGTTQSAPPVAAPAPRALSQATIPAGALLPAGAYSANTTQPAAIPATAAPAAAYFDPLQPLGGILRRPTPTVPTVAPAGGTTGNCPTGDCGPACGAPLFPTTRECGPDGCVKSRPCLERVLDWLTWHPGPGVLPLFTPTPYRAPLRTYFACPAVQTPGCGSGNCAGSGASPAGAGCGSGCGSSGNVLTRALGVASGDACAAPKHKGLGLFSHPSSSSPTTCSPSYDCVPVAVPLPAACVGYGAGCRGNSCGEGALSRVLRHFKPGNAGSVCTNASCVTPGCTGCTASPAAAAAPAWTPTWAAAQPTPGSLPTPTVTGFVPAASSPGYHFADPTSARGGR